MRLELNKQGYITNYLVSEVIAKPYESNIVEKNQLKYESLLRAEINDNNKSKPINNNWEYYFSYGNWFVDFSDFYPTLKKIDFYSTTILYAEKDMTVDLTIWSYGAIDIWLNDNYAGGIEAPVYKPISKKNITINLIKGENEIFVRLQNLGVRDTRNIFGLQLANYDKNDLYVALPDLLENKDEYIYADKWLDGCYIEDNNLVFSGEAPANTIIQYDKRPADFSLYTNRYIVEEIDKQPIYLNKDIPHFKVIVKIGSAELSRNFENIESHKIEYLKNDEDIYKNIANIGQIPRGDDRFSLYPILGRYYFKSLKPNDEYEMYHALDQIESRRDCSDFLTSALVRLLKLYTLDEKMMIRVKEVMLNYRYWMDEDGSDGMCFWSENHSLMFYVSAYISGDIWEDEIFIRANKTGREMKALAGKRIKLWMEETIKFGFDEFHSGGYTPLTVSAILNVVDFCSEELSELATKSLDRLLNDLSLQVFKGVSIAPQGRVYREVLYPALQDIQSIINLIDRTTPSRMSEWIIFFATSKYKIKTKDLIENMNKELSITYEESNAVINIEKQKDYMLTSVQSPRQDGITRRWEPNFEEDEIGYEYTKSLNELYHGTTEFKPEIEGYQQHLWYAAIDINTVTFVNHPGGSCDSTSMRPGYWYGNGVFPYLKQEKNILQCIYTIPESNPIPFTHVYWQISSFDKVIVKDNWLVGSKGNGYIGLWSSEKLIPHNDQLFNSEFKVNSRNSAYICCCESKDNFKNLDSFFEYLKSLKPTYKNNKLEIIN